MNIKNVLLICVILISTKNFSQSKSELQRGPTCTSCTDPNNEITNNGDGTFTASEADAYYWEICKGNASIINSTEKDRIAEVNGVSGTEIRIQLTRFEDGVCYESCEIFTIPVFTCPEDCIYLNVIGNSAGTDCVSAEVNILECFDQNIVSVDYYYQLYGTNCQDPNPLCVIGTSTNFPGFDASLDLSNIDIDLQGNGDPWLIIYATINYQDAAGNNYSCEVNSVQELLICDNANGGGGPGLSPVIAIFPNPLSGTNNVNFDGIAPKELESITILDITGNVINKIKPESQSFEVEELNTGIYFVEFKTIYGQITQKKLVVE